MFTAQESLLLDRIAAQMIADRIFDIDAAIEKVRIQDMEVISKIEDVNEVANAMAGRIYKKLRKTPFKRAKQVDSDSLSSLSGGHGESKAIMYLADGKITYVSYDVLNLHMRGMCKEGCPRCALDFKTSK